MFTIRLMPDTVTIHLTSGADPYNQKTAANVAFQGYGAQGQHQGYNPYDQNQNEDNFAADGGHLGEKSLTASSRMGFIRKVYCILAAQLILTAMMSVAIFASDNFRIWLYQNPWILVVTSVLSIILIYALGCYRSVARSVPMNYILLTIFTLCEALMVASITARYDPATVMIAAAVTAAAVVGLTIYAFKTNTDFTILGGVLFAAVLVLLVASIISIFVHNRWLQLAIAVMGAIVFSIYIIFDTQLIIGKQSNALSIDDYVWAAMMLYIDIVQLFLYVLQILGTSK